MRTRSICVVALLSTACGDKDSESGGGQVELSEFETDDDGDGFSEADGDCDDTNAEVTPGASEVCDGIDNDCSGAVDDDAEDATVWYADADADGYGAESYAVTACGAPEGYVDVAGDCHDQDAAWYPGAPEDDCADANDYNCDGSVGSTDADGDGFVACEDCDDGDETIHPDASEVCDEVDNDCSGLVDDDATDADTWYADSDGDTYGDPDAAEVSCEQPDNHVADATDCDDGDTAVNPGADEVCNDLDDDCDGTIDNDDALDTHTWYVDADGDGAGDALSSSQACNQPVDTVDNGDDCDDSTALARPGGSEVCDGLDNDCDGTADNDDALDAGTWYADTDGDSYGDAVASMTACSQPSGYVSDATDCDDDDGDISPAGEETCNETDDDCDGDVDENATDAGTWYADTDGDGYGSGTGHTACEQPSGFEDNADDCDDTSAGVYPGAAELCDAMANDCDTATSWVASDEDGVVSFESSSGSWSDESGSFGTTAVSATSVSLASEGTLWVCDGTYYANVDVTADVALVGRNGAGSTALSGAGAGTVITVTAASVDIDGLTITDGEAAAGGGMYITGSSDVTLTDVTVSECEATSGSGGGIYIDSGTLTADELDGHDNISATHGGGLYADDAAVVTLSGGTWTGNEAVSQGGALGMANAATYDLDRVILDENTGYYAGGIQANGTVTMADCAITDNLATYRGGGLSAGSSGDITATDSVFSGNDGTSWGGAVFCNTCTLSLTDTDFTDNSSGSAAAVGGHAITLTATGGSWSGNTVDTAGGTYPGYGGALQMQGSSVVDLDEVEIHGNSATNGGGISATASTVTLTDVTVQGNTASVRGGGVLTYGASVWDVTDGEFSGNTAGAQGGGFRSSGTNDSVTFEGTTFADNLAGSSGGGIHLNNSATLSLTSVEMTDNVALTVGGAVSAAHDSASVTIDSSAFEDNYASEDGGALYLTSATVTTSDFSGNDPDDTFNDEYGDSATWGTSASFTCSASQGCQ